MLVRSIENGGGLVGSPLVTNSSVLTRTKPFALHARSKAPLLSKRPIDGWTKCHAWSRLVCTGLHIGQAPTHISCTQVIAPSPSRRHVASLAHAECAPTPPPSLPGQDCPAALLRG